MITETFSVTQLSRLTGKSRPTVYKYISDYESGNIAEVPKDFREVFRLISEGANRSEVYAYCEENFLAAQFGNGELAEIVGLITDNKDKINLQQLKEYLVKEIKKWRKQ